MEKTPPFFLKIMVTTFSLKKLKFRALCSQSEKNRVYPKAPFVSQKWTFINVQNGFFFFQFNVEKCRSPELHGETIRI
jgi:hypothetical protein